MKLLTMSRWIGLGASALWVLGSCDAVQPKPVCKAQPAEYAARYTPSGTPTGDCAGKMLTAEILNLQYYRPNPMEANGKPSLAIEPESVVHALEEAMAHTGQEYSQGAFLSVEPPDDNICRAPSLSDTNVTADGNTLTYKWSNVAIFSTPLLNANHFGADLTRTDGACTVTYKVSGIYPAVHCGTGTKVMTDDAGNPVMDPQGNPVMEPDPTTGRPDPTLCDATAGNKISPLLDLECDASADGTSGTHLCVPRSAFPSLKK